MAQIAITNFPWDLVSMQTVVCRFSTQGNTRLRELHFRQEGLILYVIALNLNVLSVITSSKIICLQLYYV